jgi:hypothetical protein
MLIRALAKSARSLTDGILAEHKETGWIPARFASHHRQVVFVREDVEESVRALSDSFLNAFSCRLQRTILRIAETAGRAGSAAVAHVLDLDADVIGIP